MRPHLKISIILCVLALAALAGYAGTLQANRPAGMAVNKPALETIEPNAGVAGLALGGPFELIDENGAAVSEKTFLGSYTLIFFGFTFCPDICPVELKKVAQILKLLGPEAGMVTPLFVTTDPARDTPEVMKSYTDQYDPRLIGLTGSVAQIKHMEDIFKVYSAKIEDPRFSDYMVNHSSFLYFMDPEGKTVALFHPGDTADNIAKSIQGHLQNL